VSVVAGIYGDLVESLLKRNVGAKDSGTLLPGHGGILDRLDSIVLATPFAFVYLKIFL
jgi:phosphatidate cytidylyltransferase